MLGLALECRTTDVFGLLYLLLAKRGARLGGMQLRCISTMQVTSPAAIRLLHSISRATELDMAPCDAGNCRKLQGVL